MRIAVALATLAACGGAAETTKPSPATVSDPPPKPASALRAQFTADPSIDAGHEAYICYSLDVDGLDGARLGRVTWYPPAGPVRLHHASLFGAAGLPDVGEVPCDPMPERVAALGVYTPGAVPLQLPEGVAISLPPGTRRLLVLAHAMRFSEGPANPTYVDLERAPEPVQHVVNWVDIFGPVPALAPGQAAEAVGTCRFDQPTHIVSVWPHMHRLGAQFQGIIARADGRREALLDLPTWDYDHQLTYPVDVQLDSGDVVETHCFWNNTTSATVSLGPYSTDEMCNQGLFVWPFDHALCGQ